MSILATVILVILVCGFLVWCLQFLPIDAAFLSLARGLILFVMVLYVLAVVLGFAPGIPIRYPR